MKSIYRALPDQTKSKRYVIFFLSWNYLHENNSKYFKYLNSLTLSEAFKIGLD